MKYVVLIISLVASMLLSSCSQRHSKSGQIMMLNDAEKALAQSMTKIDSLENQLNKLKSTNIPEAVCVYDPFTQPYGGEIIHTHSCE